MTNDNDLFEDFIDDVFDNDFQNEKGTQIDDNSLNIKESNDNETTTIKKNNNDNDTIDNSDNLESNSLETNCLALTIKKDYNFTVIKNVFTTTKRMTFKVFCSTILLNFLRFMF